MLIKDTAVPMTIILQSGGGNDRGLCQTDILSVLFVRGFDKRHKFANHIGGRSLNLRAHSE